MRSWKHSGFSVDQSVRLEAGDQEGIQRLLQYFLHCPFSGRSEGFGAPTDAGLVAEISKLKVAVPWQGAEKSGEKWMSLDR